MVEKKGGNESSNAMMSLGRLKNFSQTTQKVKALVKDLRVQNALEKKK
jgi:hypothetical protein